MRRARRAGPRSRRAPRARSAAGPSGCRRRSWRRRCTSGRRRPAPRSGARRPTCATGRSGTGPPGPCTQWPRRRAASRCACSCRTRRVVGHQDVHPPVQRPGGRAAHVEVEPAVGRDRERRPLERLGVEVVLGDLEDGLEPLTVGRAGNDVGVAAALADGAPEAVGEVDRVVGRDGARAAGPVAGAVPGRRDDEASGGGARDRWGEAFGRGQAVQLRHERRRLDPRCATYAGLLVSTEVRKRLLPTFR
jgi:hypothetical protein